MSLEVIKIIFLANNILEEDSKDFSLYDINGKVKIVEFDNEFRFV